MKLVFAPDTSDHPNWGCRMMGLWFRNQLGRIGAAPTWVAPSAWFLSPPPGLPPLATLSDVEGAARQVEQGKLLPDIAAILRQCDAVLFNGENHLRPRTPKGRVLLLVAFLAMRVYRKPCVLTNHTVDLSEPALAGILQSLYPLFEEVHAREETTATACSTWVAAQRLRRIPDVAYTWPAAPREAWIGLLRREGHCSAFPDSAEGFDPARPYVTVCPSSAFTLEEHRGHDPVPALIRLCRLLQEQVAPVLLVGSCVVDVQIMRKVQAATGFPLLGLHCPVRTAIDILGGAEAHIGGRWHPSIFAATGGTPTVPMGANSHKLHSLMVQLGLEGPVFDPLDLARQVEPMVARARDLVGKGEALRSRLRSRCAELAAQVEGNLDWVQARVQPVP